MDIDTQNVGNPNTNKRKLDNMTIKRFQCNELVEMENRMGSSTATSSLEVKYKWRISDFLFVFNEGTCIAKWIEPAL